MKCDELFGASPLNGGKANPGRLRDIFAPIKDESGNENGEALQKKLSGYYEIIRSGKKQAGKKK
jgi:hypothetical protein